MPKVIIQDGLEEIGQELKQRGFDIIGSQADVDEAAAVVYSGVSCEWEGIPTATNDWIEGSELPLFVNSVGMSPTETADLISSRLYRTAAMKSGEGKEESNDNFSGNTGQ